MCYKIDRRNMSKAHFGDKLSLLAREIGIDQFHEPLTSKAGIMTSVDDTDRKIPEAAHCANIVSYVGSGQFIQQGAIIN